MSKPLVVITGASSGIGAATAQAFASAGHPLLLVSRRLDRMQDLGLPNSICMAVDVTDAAAVKAAIDEAQSVYGPVDCLVNNAGVMLLGQVDVQDPGEWQTMLNVNVMGVLNGIHAVLAPMKQRGAGTIINISSVAGRKTFPNHAAYCATKFAVHALTENIREEVSGTGVRLAVIAPGVVETELLSHTTDEGVKAGYQQWKVDIGGAIGPEVVADAIMFAYNQPPNVCIREIVLAPTSQQG
jgi:NADP-dependent 3-hydroxy acid dehydrogenase YdfG